VDGGRALRTRAFWMLYGVFAATWTPVFIPLVHPVPMARGLGIAPLLAATLVSAVGVAAMAGRLVMGAASDRIGRRAALAVAFVLQAGAFMCFSWSNELAALYAASVVFGFSYGAASTLFTAIVADFFGREHAGSLAGLLFSLAGSMAACGPFAAGFIYARAGDYRFAWWLSAACNGLALSLLAFTRPPRRARRPRLDAARRARVESRRRRSPWPRSRTSTASSESERPSTAGGLRAARARWRSRRWAMPCATPASARTAWTA
jgi:OFA family oxalate/formate antiporter-like MFS transporter